VPLLVTRAPLLAKMAVAFTPPVMMPELVIWLLTPVTMPDTPLPTEMAPRLEVMLLSLRLRPVPTVAPGCTVTVSPSCAPASNPSGEGPVQVTVVPD
jgi:hypothetical protein